MDGRVTFLLSGVLDRREEIVIGDVRERETRDCHVACIASQFLPFSMAACRAIALRTHA